MLNQPKLLATLKKMQSLHYKFDWTTKMKKTQLNKTQNISSGINFQLLNKEIAVKLKIKRKTLAAHLLRIPKARIIGAGILSRSPPISKFCNDLWVCAPHNLKKTKFSLLRKRTQKKEEKGSNCFASKTNKSSLRDELVRGNEDWAKSVTLLSKGGG